MFVGITNYLVNRQPFGLAKVVSGCCALVGIALLITDGYLATLAGSSKSLIGVLMALGLCGNDLHLHGSYQVGG